MVKKYIHINKKKFSKYIVFLLIILAIISCFFLKQWKDKNNFIKTYFQIVDTYNTRYFTMEELENIYSNPDFVKNLIDFNHILHNNSEYLFIEIRFSPIELIGHWDKPLNLANGYGHKDLTNQKIEYEGKEIEITPVNAIQLGRESQSLLLNKEIFQETNFNQHDNKISLVLGNDFKNYYKIGDEIEFIYLYRTWIGTVIGFLEEETQIKLDDFSIYNLDNFMIIPFFDELSINNNLYFDTNFIQNYYMQKNNGYLKLEKKEEYKKAKNYIENIAMECNLKYIVLRGY